MHSRTQLPSLLRVRNSGNKCAIGINVAPYTVLLLGVSFVVLIAMLPTSSKGFLASGNFGRTGADYRTHQNIADFLIVGVLCLFASIRWFVGTDYLLYTLIHEQVDPHDWQQTIERSPQEVGFTVLALAVKSFSSDPIWLFATASVLTIVISYAAMRLLSVNSTVSLLTFVLFAQYFFAFNAVRQGLAIAVVYLAVGLWVRGHKILALFAAVIAGLTHTSSIVALVAATLFLLVWRRPLRARSYFLILLPAAIAARFSLTIPLVAELAEGLNPRYASYIANATEAGIGTYLMIAVVAALGSAYAMALHPTGRHTWIVKIFALALPFMLMGTSIVELGRLANYFSWALILLVPAALHSNSRNARILARLTIVFGYLYCVVYLRSFDGLLPYVDVFGILNRNDVNIHVPG